MKQRHYFYLILAFIGELFVIGQWSLFRHSLPIPEMPLLAIFMALPVLYVIPYVFSAVLPPLVTRGLTRFAGYWFSFSYYATMLLIPGLLLWIAAQLMGRNDLWQGTISVYYSAFAFALSWLLLAIGAGGAITRSCGPSISRPTSLLTATFPSPSSVTSI